jgi:hypothetical protein
MRKTTYKLLEGRKKTDKIVASLANTSHRIQKKGGELIIDVYTY